ncbi:cob(I)yrinic acid a,c-diamide adenosyltransferase [Bacterioplanes sanyensis]|jgi:cob(I)alamin adenosyltransferase|uniref:cob(I)yrinic acid a,c-diamide adenosyltransferase n=1 Tax=Bacterioplanes sanyensis TaxID=1249553 RepID=UPI0016745985|nr:cob(I)yrinic acid a,c-diamide adenosyltransferase [Bacterioplanes sanyensis]GGY34411.1 cob(I)yrinic acid a,c-diamide adenosyltransferase [Bacterioplanes sanyensis]
MTDKHQQKMQRHKEKVDAAIARAQEERGVIIVLTGAGKGKSSSGFGTLIRTLGHGYRAGLVQFIKGTWDCGESKILAQLDGLQHEVMGSGFTWETQDQQQDQAAFDAVWPKTLAMLQDPELRTVMLDEITYMLAYKLLDWPQLEQALLQRPAHQNVILTGRGAPKALRDLADTVTEMKMEKHAFKAGIKAQAGIEW